MKLFKNFHSSITFLLFFLYLFSGCGTQESSPIPQETRQMIVVLTASQNASPGTLFRFEKLPGSGEWQKTGAPIPVIAARNGLAWGRGLHPAEAITSPVKEEGDGKSPEGIFRLSAVFGFVPPDSITGLKMPYIHITEMMECIDDTGSSYYNSLVLRDSAATVDWNSSEKMNRLRHWYEWGVLVDHNKTPVKTGAGSCIFLHYWDNPADSTSGCTAMPPESLREIVFWLIEQYQPVLVQLTQPDYLKFQKAWNLPAVLNQPEETHAFF